MKIYGFQDSYIDYPGKISVILFAPSCNFSCLSCHAKQIVNGNCRIAEQDVFSYLDKRKGWTDGVVISGGEPTLQVGLENFARECKKRDLAVKLDTNGSNYAVLGELLRDRLVDYVALDVKGPPSLYKRITGLSDEDKFDFRDRIEKAIMIAQNFHDYEFRTTIVPVIRNSGFEWFRKDEAEEMASWVYGFVPGNPDKIKWYVQPFVSRAREKMMDEKFSLGQLPEEFHETPLDKLEEMREIIGKYFPNCKIR